MGYWKDVIERLGGGNPAAHENDYVCADCFEDEGLKAFVEGAATSKTCTFCGARSKEPIAAPMVDLLLHMNEGLGREFDVAENKLPFESAEGGYAGQVWTTPELLGDHLGLELPNDQDGTLMDALCDGLGDRAWCRKHPFSLTEDERLNFSWDAFSDLVKHHQHYFFLRNQRSDDEIFSPMALLEQLAGWCERFDLVETLPMGS